MQNYKADVKSQEKALRAIQGLVDFAEMTSGCDFGLDWYSSSTQNNARVANDRNEADQLIEVSMSGFGPWKNMRPEVVNHLNNFARLYPGNSITHPSRYNSNEIFFLRRGQWHVAG